MSQRMQQGQPMIILGENSQRTPRQDTQSMNIMTGKAITEAVRTTLGPKGMDKILVDPGGWVVATNDGVIILKEMDIGHSTASTIIEVSETQESGVGDGTTTAVIDVGELLDQAEDLLNSDVHMAIIAQDCHQAAEEAREVLEDNAIEVAEGDRETLTRIAAAAMIGKGAEFAKSPLSEFVADAVLAVKDDDGVDTNNVSIEKAVGGTIDNSELIKGVIADKERVDKNMPYAVEGVNIAILDDILKVRETGVGAEVNVTDPDQLQQFPDQEEKQLKGMVDQLVEIGTDAVFVSDGIDDMAQHYLAKEGILAVRRAKSSNLRRPARATDDRVVSSLDGIEADDPGFVDSVGQKDVSDDECTFIEGTGDTKSIMFILRGGTGHAIDELERVIEDSLDVVRTTFKSGKALPGDGAPKMKLSLQLREFADSVDGREQLAVEAFAKTLDIIPRTLAENAGLDPTDSLIDPHSRHDDGGFATDLDVYTGEVISMEEGGVAESLRVKTQATEPATEAMVMILRIDDTIVADDLSGGQTGSDDDDDGASSSIGGGIGGMGGMGGMDGAM